jgi:phage gp29-like protein
MILVTDTTQYQAGNVPRSTAPLSAGGPSDLRQWAARQVEKVYAAYAGGRRRLAPYLDTLTEETDEIRAAYPVMLKDGPIRASLMTKVLAVAQLPLQVHPRQKKAPRDRECGEFVRHALSKIESAQNWIGVPGIAWTVLGPACVQGFSVANKVWADQPEAVGQWRGKRLITKLKGKDVSGLRLEVDEFRNVTGIKAARYNAGEVFHPAEFVVYSHLSWYENPAGSSDFRAAYGNWWRKSFIMQLWDLHLDKFTGGMLKGTYTDVDQKEALKEALEDARSNTWIMAPMGTLVESIALATGGETAEFEKRCRYLDEQSLIAITGAFLHILSGQITDARGDTGVAKETSELFQWMLAATLAGVIEKQLVVPLVQENFADVEPPGVTLGSISEFAMQARANVDLTLQKMGLGLSADEAYGYYGRNEPADASDRLKPLLAALAAARGGTPGA